MRKIFKMANAELNKIFMRPSMFVLSTILVIALILCFVVFEPKSTTTKFGYEQPTVSAIYNEFDKDYLNFEKELISAKTDIDKFIAPENDNYLNLKTKMQMVKDRFYNHLYTAVLELPKTSEYPSPENKEKLKTEFNTFEILVKDLKNFLLDNVGGKYVNFFITTNDYDNLYNTIKNLAENIPSSTRIETQTTKVIVDTINLIESSFNLKELNTNVSRLEKIEINSNNLTNLLNLYYYPNITEDFSQTPAQVAHTGKLKQLYDDIKAYYDEHATTPTSEKAVLDELNNKIAKYYDYIQICKTLLKNNFELLRIGSKTDDQIVNYNGFSGVSIYNLKHDITLSEYYYKNNTFGYEYLNAFNFNTNSGTQTNAYDFSFFAMQILSSLIIIFAIFFASSSLNGEQNTGTLKMTAIRPYTRNKIYSGKFIATLNVSLILLTISLISSMAVGIATFGLTTQNALIVVNASNVLIVNPLVLMLIYLASILVDIIFYISLATFVSMLIKSTTINTAITSGVFIASSVICGTTNASFIRYFPFTHTGLFKYFTNSNLGIFSFSVVPGVNLITSLLVIALSIFAFDLIGRLLFSRKSLDK